MQLLFSTFVLISIIGFSVWWSMRDTSYIPASDNGGNTSTQETPENTINTPIEQAKDVKQLIESKNLISLDLSGQGLTKVPVNIFEKTDLEVLNLSSNNLTGALQAEVRHLQNLKTFDLSNNKFTGVPAEVGQLKKLETLDLSNNLLTGLPHELGNLSNLKVLDLSGNNYSEADLEVIRKGLSPQATIKTK